MAFVLASLVFSSALLQITFGHMTPADDLDLFYSAILLDPTELMPVVYTPGVGAACQQWGYIEKTLPYLQLSVREPELIGEKLRNWPNKDIKVIVVTDGERILGLGDLGVWGAGIPVGKLALYTALAGIAPQNTLPIQIDAGTNTPRLWGDDKYLGSKGGRVRGEAYNSFMETFVRAVADTWPHALLQFEDFGGDNAFALLDRYRDSLPSFNDDIQGTAAVVLSGLMTANRLGLVAKSLFGDFGSNKDPALSEYVQALTGNTYLFLGAGQAGVGIADLLVKAMVERESVSEQFARNRIWLMDKNGLITSDRTDLQGQPKARYAKARLMGMEDLKLTDLLEVVNVIRPSALIGVSTVGGAFTPAVLRAMAFHNIHPIIMPLSNPTSHSECTFEEAMEFTDGKVIFASGSPFPPLEWDGRIMTPGQANNCFVFPGVGLGVTLARASRVSEGMMLAAAEALSTVATKDERDHGSLYPMVTRARVASEAVAAAVAETAWKEGLATLPRPDGDMRALARAAMWMPRANVVMG